MHFHRTLRRSLLVFGVLTGAAAPASAQGLTINTVAGDTTLNAPAPNGFSGDGGPATSARLSEPYGVAIDAAGNIYIADTRNNRIRKVSASNGVISTFAGNGNAGFSGDGGQATSASLNQPTGVAVDSSGNVFIADQKNNRIRKVGTNGVISTIVGNGQNAFYTGENGPAVNAQICFPYDVTVDGSGNVYLTDTGNMAVRKVTTDGKIHTLAGVGVSQCGLPGGFNGESGTATQVTLDNPNGIAVDASGNVYIADTWNNRVRKVTPAGALTTIAGTGATTSKNGANFQTNPNGSPRTNGGYNGDSIAATSATLNWPYGVAVDGSGNIFISDYFNYRIRKITSGVITTVAGNGLSGYDGDGGSSTAAYISDPANVNVDGSGNFYIVDQATNRIRKVFPTPPPPTSAPPSVTLNPTDQFVASGGTATFQSAASGTPAPTVQWQVSVDGGATFSNVSGATGTVLSFGALTADNGKKYRAVFANAYGSAATAAATLFVRVPASPRTDIDGDGVGDLTVWRPSNAIWFTLTSSSGYTAQAMHQWGSQSAGDVPLMGDMDGDRIADFVVWRASTGTWFWLTSSSGYAPAQAGMKQWGSQSQGDVPMLADMDGDGKMDLVLWRASTGTWFWLTSSSGYNYNASGVKQWGNQGLGDVPKVGDVDGDGRGDLIVWRASSGTWFWLTSSSGYNYGNSGQKQWGNQSAGDVPMIGDLDGDGKTELVVWRASSGTWYWLSSTSGYANATGIQWGNQSLGDIPLLTDIDGDGKGDLTVWRASNGTWFWLKSTKGYDYNQVGARQWGSQSLGDMPIVK